MTVRAISHAGSLSATVSPRSVSSATVMLKCADSLRTLPMNDTASVNFSSLKNVRKKVLQGVAIVGLALTPLSPQSTGQAMLPSPDGGATLLEIAQEKNSAIKSDVAPFDSVITPVLATDGDTFVRTSKKISKADKAKPQLTRSVTVASIEPKPVDKSATATIKSHSVKPSGALAQPMEPLATVAPVSVSSQAKPGSLKPLRIGPEVVRRQIDYTVTDTTDVFSDADAKAVQGQLKKASIFHKWAHRLGLRKLKTSIENKIIYHPEGTHNYTAPDSLRGLPVQHKFITTPSGGRVESYYQPASSPDAYTWVLTHGNAYGMQSMEGLASQIPEGDGFVMYGLPGFNKSVNAKGRAIPSEKGSVEAFHSVLQDLEQQGVPKSRIPVIGVSLGGAVTTLAMGQDTANYHHPAMVVISSLADGKTVYNYFLDKAGLDVTKYTVGNRLGQTLNAADAVKQVRTPVLVFGIGTEDSFLKPDMPGGGMTRLVGNAILSGKRNQRIEVLSAPIDHRVTDIEGAFAPQLHYIRSLMEGKLPASN